MAILIISYPCYKGIRELVWVRQDTFTIDNNLQVKLRIDPDILGFQDMNVDKTITLLNKMTNKKLHISYVSLELNLYFFLDSVNSKEVISIVDQFAGQNFYDYSTLQLLTKEDCFKDFGGCGGCNDSCLTHLGKPYLIYDDKGLHR